MTLHLTEAEARSLRLPMGLARTEALTPEFAARFWEKVDQRPGPETCWKWLRSYATTGYGQVSVAGHMERAHRVAWTLVHGPIPAGAEVCHHCDNKACCNPAHLFLGTHAENMRDMHAKGYRETATGYANAKTRLNPEIVQSIHSRTAAGESTRTIGRALGLSKSTVSKVLHGASWLDRPGSEAEEAFAVQIRYAGLPEPVREHRLMTERRFRFDFAWPDRKLALEVDGGVYSGGRHTRGAGYEADCVKLNTALCLGWRVLRVTPGMVESGVALDFVERALTREED